MNEQEYEQFQSKQRSEFFSRVKIGDKVGFNAPMTRCEDATFKLGTGGRLSFVATYKMRLSNKDNSDVIIEDSTGTMQVDCTSLILL